MKRLDWKKANDMEQSIDVKKILETVRFYDGEVYLILKNIDNLNRLGFIDSTEHINQLTYKIKRLQAEKLAVSRAIERIPDIVARMIYNGRYNLGYSWERVAGKMTPANARLIHNRMLPEFEKLFLEELKNASEQ